MVGYGIEWDGAELENAVQGVMIQKVSRRLIGEVRDQARLIPGRDGAYLFPERRGDRIIRADGLVVREPSLRHTAVTQLADWLDRSGVRELFINDQPDRFWRASVLSDPDPDEWKATGKFSIEWRAEPYAYGVDTTSVCVTATNAAPYNFALPGNVGSEPIATVRPLNGTLTSFTLTVNTDGLTFNGLPSNTVNLGQTVTVNSLVNTVTLGINTDTQLLGAYTPGTQLYGMVSGTFPVILPGTNNWSLAWGGTATQVQVCFLWRRRYR